MNKKPYSIVKMLNNPTNSLFRKQNKCPFLE